VTQQLTDGVRLLQVQALQQPDGVHLCHTSCVRLLVDQAHICVITFIRQLLKDSGLAVKYFQTVKTWVDGNTDDGESPLLSLPQVFTSGPSGDYFDRQYQQSAPIAMAVDIPVCWTRHSVLFAH
jgi:hypothetical protein